MTQAICQPDSLLCALMQGTWQSTMKLKAYLSSALNSGDAEVSNVTLSTLFLRLLWTSSEEFSRFCGFLSAKTLCHLY